jgi:hypothetical protein
MKITMKKLNVAMTFLSSTLGIANAGVILSNHKAIAAYPQHLQIAFWLMAGGLTFMSLFEVALLFIKPVDTRTQPKERAQ